MLQVPARARRNDAGQHPCLASRSLYLAPCDGEWHGMPFDRNILYSTESSSRHSVTKF